MANQGLHLDQLRLTLLHRIDPVLFSQIHLSIRHVFVLLVRSRRVPRHKTSPVNILLSSIYNSFSLGHVFLDFIVTQRFGQSTKGDLPQQI